MSVQNRCLSCFLTRRRVATLRKASRCVSTPIIRGKPCTWHMLRNSNVSISKPKLASTTSSTRSATLERSTIAFMSHGHSMIVSLRCLPVTTVTGPITSWIVCFVQCLTSDVMMVVLPTPAGPTTTTVNGGGVCASTDRSTSPTWYFFSCFSSVRYALSRIALMPPDAANAFGLFFALPLPRRAALAFRPFFAFAPFAFGGMSPGCDCTA
mmetsp:Transcript_40877/g.101601  ORF Transcript_40877/g.101601 Transcript_40877/m.101601 type:complete len:210 (-) Transcript_40877:85-714(-)